MHYLALKFSLKHFDRNIKSILIFLKEVGFYCRSSRTHVSHGQNVGKAVQNDLSNFVLYLLMLPFTDVHGSTMNTNFRNDILFCLFHIIWFYLKQFFSIVLWVLKIVLNLNLCRFFCYIFIYSNFLLLVGITYLKVKSFQLSAIFISSVTLIYANQTQHFMKCLNF